MTDKPETALNIVTFADRDTACAAAADRIMAVLNDQLNRRMHLSMALSGGTSPAPVFERLSHALIDWSRIHIVPTDDRWVDAASPASNQRLMRESLLKNYAKAAKFFPLVTQDPTPQQGEAAVAAALEAFAWPLAVALVGMGPDGHFASIFPGADGVERALTGAHGKPVAAIKAVASEVTGDNVNRMTLTMPSLLDADCFILLVFGAAKKALLDQVIAGDETVAALPIHMLAQAAHHAGKTIEVYWAE